MSKKKNKTENRIKVMNRYGHVILLFFVLGIVVIGRICYLTFVESSYWEKVAERFVRENVEIPAQRGDILAADGQVLATSLPEYRLYMDFMAYDKDSILQARQQMWRDSIICADTLRVIPGLLNRKREPISEDIQRAHIDSCKRTLDELCQGMHEIFPDIDPTAFRALLKEGRHKNSKHWPIYKPKVSYIDYCRVKELPFFCLGSNRTGLHTADYRTRQNPYGKLAARTVGDLYGEKDSARCGLELSFDSLLRGKPGYCHRQKVKNKFIPFYDKMPENGCDLRTTLDINMQDLVEKTLGDHLKEIGADFGICILMETATGDIKAISSLDRLADGSYKEIGNRAVSLLMEPGSVFKTVSFMVGLDDGAFTMNSPIETGNGIYMMYGRRMTDSNWRSGGHGHLQAHEVLECSSNIGTSRLIDNYYHNIPDKFVQGIDRTGIREDLQLPLIGYAKPKIRMPKKDSTGKHWANWSNTALPWMSIGYETQVPPISTLTFYNGIANGGKVMYPRFVKSLERNGEVITEYPTRVLREQMCKASTVEALQKTLRNTVVMGTGKQAGSKLFGVSGKTGTAQIWNKNGNTSKYLVSFVGYFPSEKPKYSMIVCVKKSSPAYGGMHCGPVFKKVAEMVMAQSCKTEFPNDTAHTHRPVVRPGNMSSTSRVLSQLKINHDSHQSSSPWGNAQHTSQGVTLSTDNQAKGLMPNLQGYGLRDAVYRLEQLKLKVSVSGRGHVIKQSITPGSPIKPGQAVSLVLSTSSTPLPEDTIPAPKPEATPTSTTDSTQNKPA